MIKYQTHNVLLKLLLFLFVIHNATSLHCSPYCTYTFVPGSNNYVPGCTGLGSNQCTECDPRFYYPIPSAGTCVFNETNIYNSSIGFTINSWNSNGGVNTNPDDGDNWLRINNQYTVLNVVNEVQPIGNSAFRPVAYYGVRCRIHFSLKGPNF
jgi:hypothetical protein